MKCYTKLWFAICINTVLTACTFGNGRICGPQTPIAYCDKEAYQQLVHPKPYLQRWEKPGMTPEARRQDSASCGGGSSDSPGFSHRTKDAKLSNEKEHETYSRLHHEWERCMLQKGYRYTGKCHDSEISRAKPACGAP